MAGALDHRTLGAVFDTVAVEYDRRRPTYPDELVERACELGRLAGGDPVLEVGCGTGQLTRSLVARGLCVTAVEPGANLIELGGREVRGPGTLEFVNCRLEDAPIDGGFAATFSAAAFHWPDPDVSWAKVAAVAQAGWAAGADYSTARYGTTTSPPTTTHSCRCSPTPRRRSPPAGLL